MILDRLVGSCKDCSQEASIGVVRIPDALTQRPLAPPGDDRLLKRVDDLAGVVDPVVDPLECLKRFVGPCRDLSQ